MRTSPSATSGPGAYSSPKPTILLVVAILLACTSRPALGQIAFTDPKFSAETVASLPTFSPVGVAFAADGRLFVWQRQGLVRVVKDGALLSTPFLDIQSKVNQFGDRGLLGLALDPDFPLIGHIYLLYVHEAGGNPNGSGPKTARLTRVTADPANPDVALPGSETVILDDIPSEGESHSIGTIRVAPDGMLVLGVGDAASFTFPDPSAFRAQDLNSLNGKILRIRPDGTAPGDNPFDDGTDSVRSKVLAYGLRNPFRFALHPVTGMPHVADVGWNAQEEIDRGLGANFGWPCWEGPSPQAEYQSAFPSQCAQVPLGAVTLPLHAYSHSVGAAVIAGAFYTGTQYPAQYQGNLFIADYVAGWIRRMVFDAAGGLQSVQAFASGISGPVALEQGLDGHLYYVEFNSGRVGRIRYNGPLAEASASPTAGYSPLDVSFSSAGSRSPSGSATYSWTFGDGATSTAPNPSHTFVAATPTTFTATLTVTEPGGASSTDTVRIVLGSRPPAATIATPADGTGVFVGQDIVYQGSAVDPDEGPLPAGALSWTVLLHHNTHVHPVQTATGSGGTFRVVDHGAGTFAYEVILTATDATGLQGAASVLLPVNPQTLPYPTGVAFSPATVAGGESTTGTVTISQPAPTGGLGVSLSSTSAAVQVPPSVTVEAGASSATFTATTSPVTATVVATVTASANGSVQGVLTVSPPPSVVALTLSPSTVIGGGLATGAVTLSSPATGAGTAVALSSSVAAVQVPATVTIPGGATTGSFLASTSPVDGPVTATVTASLNGSAQATLNVDSGGIATAFVFGYADRIALLADGWDFIARTAGGSPRDTEQIGSLAIDYDQTRHPGAIRVPLGTGELWQGANNSQNMLFRTLPADWISIRLRIAAFSPVANYQQVGLIAYQDDDTYVNVQRNFNDTAGGPVVGFFKEVGGVVTRTDRRPLSNTGNLILRLDRNPGTNVFTAFYSGNGGSTWVQLTGTPTQALANPRLAIQVGAAVGATTTTADLAWVEIVRPNSGATPPPPTLTSVSPAAGAQGQALSVVLAGTNFAAGMTCSFGPGVTTSSCTPTSSTQFTAAIAVSSTAAVGPRTVTVTNPDGQAASLASGFSVTAAPPAAVAHIDFTYPDRSALLADGWSFIARTASGGTRNTEQTGALAINYDQATHPGTIRIPVGPGELWEGANDSRNMLFRDLPSDWTSIRLRIATFSPTRNYQQVGLIAYQDDNTYVNVQRNYNGGPVVGFFKEVGGVTTRTDRRTLSNTGNLTLRLDRDPATNVLTAFYSVNDGSTWIQLTGAPTQALAGPRLALQIGANTTSTVPTADLAWVEIHRPGASGEPGPAPTLASATPASGFPGESLAVTLAGSNFAAGMACTFGAGVNVTACSRDTASQATAAISIAASATAGPRAITVTNPDGQGASLPEGFTVLAAPAPAVTRIDFTYPDRAALLADGWSFIARPAAGGSRDTEQTGILAVDYDQAAHPGRLRVPIGPGELWQGANDSQNTLFRDLPVGWTSVRLKIAAFAPTSNYQQVGLIAYQDDDNYVNLNRAWVGGPLVELFAESGGAVAGKAGQVPLVNTGNLILRLDRNPATSAFTASYSVDDGASWTSVPGSVTRTLTNVRLAIHVANDLTGTAPTADIAWVEIVE